MRRLGGNVGCPRRGTNVLKKSSFINYEPGPEPYGDTGNLTGAGADTRAPMGKANMALVSGPRTSLKVKR
jgi:hypothetical protein